MSDKTITPETEMMLSQQELAKRWGMTVRTLANWRAAGKGPSAVSLGGLLRYRLSDVVHFETEEAKPGSTHKNRFPEGAQAKGVDARKK